MDTASSGKQNLRIIILALAVLVCAWLLPTGVGIAASAASSMKVTLTVEDAVGVNYGRSALDSGSVGRPDQVITEFVTRTASSRLAVGTVVDEARGPQADENGVPFGSGTDTGPGDAVSGGEYDDSSSSERVVVVTVSSL